MGVTGSKKRTVDDIIFDMNFKSKEFIRNAAKCEKQCKVEESKVKNALLKGNYEGARIFAESSIRKKHESFNWLKLSAKLDCAASRLETAHATQMMTSELCSAIPKMDKVLLLGQDHVTENMSKFEEIFQSIDSTSEVVAKAMDTTSATLSPEDEISKLLSRVAEEHAVDVSHLFTNVPDVLPVSTPAIKEPSTAEVPILLGKSDSHPIGSQVGDSHGSSDTSKRQCVPSTEQPVSQDPQTSHLPSVPVDKSETDAKFEELELRMGKLFDK